MTTKEVVKQKESMITHDFPTKDNPIAVTEVSARYIQEADSNSDNSEIQSLHIETSDAGGGVYYILKSERWAFDSIEDLVKVLNDFVKRINP